MQNLCKFVHTYVQTSGIIILVKPPIHYIVFCYPHSKKYLLFRKEQPKGCFFHFIKRTVLAFFRRIVYSGFSFDSHTY